MIRPLFASLPGCVDPRTAVGLRQPSAERRLARNSPNLFIEVAVWDSHNGYNDNGWRGKIRVASHRGEGHGSAE